jgi:hypothetical protein
MCPREFGFPVALLAVVLLIGTPAQPQAQDFTVELDVGGRRLEGGPLAWTQQQVHLLARDGELWSISPQRATKFRRSSDRFQSLSVTELRGQLQREFPARFEVSARSCYLVVHPRGQADRWPERFEQLHRSFVQHFTVRGWRPAPPQFPLVAVVLGRPEEFQQYAAREGANLLPGTVGYYSGTTNRVWLYDAPPNGDDVQADANLATVMHEATHQLAFNTGIHNRFAPPPLWVAEGLSTLFESPGVWNARNSAKAVDRIDKRRLADFREFATTSLGKGDFSRFLSSDALFHSRTKEAYATSWAFTYFLTETVPRDYLEYLRATASRPNFSDYAAAERLADFRQVFGTDLAVLEARFLRFAAELARQLGVEPR